MTQRSAKVLTPRPRPTKNRYRSAIAQMIREIKAEHGLTNDDLGDRVGCTGQTIGNAENEKNDLSALTLASIQHEFGAHAIDRFQSLSGARGVPEGETTIGDLNTILRLAEAITKLAETRDPNSEAGVETGHREAIDLLPILRRARVELDHEILRITPIALGAAA